MRFPTALVSGRLLRRYKRFFADVELDDGTLVNAHCANPGSMKTCLTPGGRVWLSRSDDPKRKLRYTWEIAQVAGARVFVNPLRANALVKEALARGTIRELLGYDSITPEIRTGRSRIDFLLRRVNKECYVEVKSVTLNLGQGRTAFPDAVSERGTRHLKELIQLKRQGHRAVLLFSVGRSDARSAQAASDIDPTYAEWLCRASQHGVEILAYKCRVSAREVRLERPLPVLIGS